MTPEEVAALGALFTDEEDSDQTDAESVPEIPGHIPAAEVSNMMDSV